MHRLLLAAALALFALPAPLLAQTQQGVTIGDKKAFLHVPPNARASAMLVLISGSLMTPGKQPAQEALKTPTVLPPTLVMANRKDACDLTPAAGADAEVVDGIARFVIR